MGAVHGFAWRLCCNAARSEGASALFPGVRSLAFSAAAMAATKQPIPEGRLKGHLERRWRRRVGTFSSTRSARLRSCGRNFSQRNSIRNRMTPSPVGLLDNCSRRSSSASAALIGRRRRGFGPCRRPPRRRDLRSKSWRLAARASGACAAAGAGGVSGGTSLSSSARADCAWGPSGWAVRNARHPSVDFVRSSDSIVQVLVEIRGGDGVHRRKRCLRLCGREGLGDEDADVAKPSRLCDVFEARRVRIHGRKRQRQKEHVFPSTKHAPHD